MVIQYPFVVLDGTLIRTGQVAANQPFFSGKHHCHGMNLQVMRGKIAKAIVVLQAHELQAG